MAKINIRNLYIDLLNKIKQSEGASKEYVDGQVSVIDQHLTTIDGDITAINSVIPETASATNQLITGDDITGSETFGPASSITIEDSEAFNLAACEVDIEPIQDLHGYDKPWVGGANINKLPCKLEVQTITKGGYTATTDGNGEYSITGNNSDYVDIYFDLEKDYVTPDGSIHTLAIQNSVRYDYMGMALFYNGTYIEQALFSEANRKTHYSGLSQVTFNQIGFRVKGNIATKITMKPYIYYGNPTDNVPFSSYSNICPITGTSSEDLTVSNDDDTKTTTIDLDGTRYGVNINLKSGVMTVKKEFVVYDGSDDESWSLGSGVNGFFLTSTNASQMLYTSNKKTVISNMYETINNTSTWATILASDNVCCITKDGNNNRFTVRTRSIDTVANWRTYLASNPLQVCYELVTPITVQLTPVQIQLLTGTVTISASSGTITVTTTKLTGAVEDLTALVDDILPKLPAPPTTDGSYNLTVTVSDGVPVYTWEATT